MRDPAAAAADLIQRFRDHYGPTALDHGSAWWLQQEITKLLDGDDS